MKGEIDMNQCICRILFNYLSHKKIKATISWVMTKWEYIIVLNVSFHNQNIISKRENEEINHSQNGIAKDNGKNKKD